MFSISPSGDCRPDNQHTAEDISSKREDFSSFNKVKGGHILNCELRFAMLF